MTLSTFIFVDSSIDGDSVGSSAVIGSPNIESIHDTSSIRHNILAADHAMNRNVASPSPPLRVGERVADGRVSWGFSVHGLNSCPFVGKMSYP